jgi:hypothetical protein
MDKSQDSVCFFEEYLRLFPEIRFLDIVRDPRGQISSMNCAIIYDFDTQLNTQRWVQSRKWVEKIRDNYPEKILTIRYEDFIISEGTILRRICDFLQIPFESCMTEIRNSDEARHMSSLSPLWETNSSVPITAPIEKFRQYLSINEIEAIETLTLPWMKKFDYIPMTSHISPFTYSLETAHEVHARKKKEAWDRLRTQHPHDYIMRKKRMHYISTIDWSCTQP